MGREKEKDVGDADLPPENLEELRRLKKVEQDRINGRYARIRRCRNELEYKNKVTYFVTKLPNGCNRDGLWRAYEHHHNLMDASIPSKKDRWGNTFGFLRFVEVEDVDTFKKELEKTMVDGKKVRVSIARWDKDSEGNDQKEINREFSHHPLPPSTVWTGDPMAYRNATVGNIDNRRSQEECVMTVITAPRSSPTAHPLVETSLVGSINDASILNDLPFYLKRWSGLDDCVVRYMGGLSIILTFPTKQDSITYRETKGHMWGSFFSSLEVWDGISYPKERLAWITVRGIPPDLFGTKMIHKVAASFGKVVAEVDVSNLESNLAFTRVPILIKNMEKVNKKVLILHQGVKFECWVYEDLEEWIPGFMRVGSPSFSTDDDDQKTENSPSSVQHVGEDDDDEEGAKETDQHGEVEPNDDVLPSGSHISPGPIADEISQSSHEIGPVNSDPFNLGPIIDEVMACHNMKAKNNLGAKSSKTIMTETAGGRRYKRRNINLPDLNLDIYDVTRFKLSRYLLSRNRKLPKRKGNSVGASHITDPHEEQSEAALHNDHEVQSCPNSGDLPQHEGSIGDLAGTEESNTEKEIDQEMTQFLLGNQLTEMSRTCADYYEAFTLFLGYKSTDSNALSTV
ncbi:hypothetical protein QVD17_09203 [Tagetes erecta]|uniref:RRM domain-containing protein n=1 Tax=Tagetes erecta TaxID=13708 RepID=A0AAD8L3G6_TARER|nr:hypothetical protein QVD17_09203 [Tagetes erecta]